MNQNDFPPLTLVRIQFLPTPRSRKWRNASLSKRWFGKECIAEAIALQKQEGWHDVRWVAVPYG